jgi:hypothetical protein
VEIIKKINLLVFLMTITALFFLLFYEPPLPETNKIDDRIKNNNPLQKSVNKKPINLNLGGYEYKITPLFSYELWGLVVTQYDSSSYFDIRHEQDPGNTKDICVVWGDNVKNGSYKKVKFKSGEFTCYYEWGSDLKESFSFFHTSNNHLIPANDEVEKVIKSTQIGDQIHFKGYIATYEVYKDDKLIMSRDTSTTREDVGNDSCEVVYVTDYKVIKKDNYDLDKYIPLDLKTLAASTVLGIILFLFT